MALHKAATGIHDFGIPDKNNRAIQIKSPNEQPDSCCLQVATGITTTSTSNLLPAPSSSSSSSSASVLAHTDKSFSDGAKPLQRTYQQLKPSSNQFTSWPLVATTATSQPLDIYSPHYVPRWLRAVNESAAELYPCESFPKEDFPSYIATLVGPDFAQAVSQVSLPPPLPTTIDTNELAFGNYLPFWLRHLQNEFAQQKILLESFSLYNTPLQQIINRPSYFTLHVPGLRENTPRLDLGDFVELRPLQAGVSHIEYVVEYWLAYGKQQGMICPGFTGILYEPQVWEIDRLNEKVTLRIDTLSGDIRCNVIFCQQISKLEPICRAVQAASHGGQWLRRMLFPRKEDGVTQTRLSRAYFDISWINDLNREQKKAVHAITSANYGSIPYLISGPPGTGKTRTLVETTLQLLRKPGHILVCAPSDTAADTVALRLSLHLGPSELFRLNSWTRSFAEVPDRLLTYTHTRGLTFALPPVERLLSFRVVVTTCREADLLVCARLTNVSLHNLFNGVGRVLRSDITQPPLHWTALLLDEAAQATEPEILIPLTVVMPPDGEFDGPQFIAAGDQYQLGPKVLSTSPLAVSLFQRLFERPLYDDHPLSRKHGTQFITASMLPMLRPAFANLLRNYRSHPAILSVPSALFYRDTLIPERRTSGSVLRWPGWPSERRWPVAFVQNDSEDRYDSVLDGDGTGVGTLSNYGEALIALETAKSLLRHVKADGSPVLRQDEIMIMTPFRAQVTQLRALFRRNDLFEVNIGPLEAFQGLESRIVILCTTRTRLGVNGRRACHHVWIDQGRGLGVIDEPRRFNVALTRAQEGLVVIGNARCLVSTGDQQWLAFLGFCRRNRCYNAPDDYAWPDFDSHQTEGRLEKALTYAELARAGAGATTTATDKGNEEPVTDVNGMSQQVSRLNLRGPLREMDEQMWLFKEMADANGSEQIDLTSTRSHSELDVIESVDSPVGESNDIGMAPVQEQYDRDLKQEFHEQCTTQ